VPASLLRNKINSQPLVVAMAAHNPLGARMVEEAGFDAVWASGFELSASLAVPDASIITPSDQLEMARRMTEACSLPIVADIDTGFGNAVNVHYAVRRYALAGAAAVVMEDKCFPKDTSLREDSRQRLLDPGEFQGKIEAAVDARGEDGPLVIARTEALIAGAGLREALDRAAAYSASGADMILVHSKSKTPDEIEAFTAAWEGTCPLAVVPTAYPEFDEARAAASGKIRLLIYGNHGLRAAVTAMREAFRVIRKQGSAAEISGKIASVRDILELQGDSGLRKIEKRFLR